MSSRRFLPALFLLFVGSGCAALIYEIVWFQLLQLVIGSSSISLGILLGTFMGGMCLGSLLLPRLISARQHPLRVYAAARARHRRARRLLILVAMPLVGGIYTAWAGEGVAGIVFRAIIAGICLLPPTHADGRDAAGDLALGRRRRRTASSWLGFFYGGNIAGGVHRQPRRRLLPAARVRRRDGDRRVGVGAQHRRGADRVRRSPAGPVMRTRLRAAVSAPAPRRRDAGGLRGDRALRA